MNQPDAPPLRAIVIELKMLMGTMAKVARMSLEQRLQSQGDDIGILQYHVLRVLGMDGAQTISELAKKHYLDPSTLVPAIDGLARKSYITRERDPSDRRRVILQIDERGKEVLKNFDMVSADDAVLKSLEKMGIEDALRLVTLLKTMISHLPEGDVMLESVQSRIFNCGHQKPGE